MARFIKSFGRDRGFRARGDRDNFRGDREFSSRPKELTTVTCDQCGSECEVPFKPTPGKPVYCDNCFRAQGKGRQDVRSFGNEGRNDSRSFGRGERSFGRESRGRTEKTEAICDKCGKTCYLPFKPTGGKPVYCSNCFEEKTEKAVGVTLEQFQELSRKIDRIMKALNIE